MRALVVGLLVVAPAWARADVVELTTGERVEGRDVRASPDLVTIQVGGRTLIFERDRIRAIYLGPPPAPCRRFPFGTPVIENLGERGVEGLSSSLPRRRGFQRGATS